MTAKKITIIDYGMGNLFNVIRAFEALECDVCVTNDINKIITAERLLLPGVGAFNDAMHELHKRQLVKILREQVLTERIPFLGICLGMQLMASIGHENGTTEGLALVPGEIHKLKPQGQERIPHVGWNEVVQNQESDLFADIPDKTDFYFVHSYCFQCRPEFILAHTPYSGGFISAVGHEQCFGVQFHPEKSLNTGLALLKNFIELC